MTARCLLGALLLAFIGCRPSEQITSYEIDRPKEAAKPDRMLGAIAFNGDTAWFFKSTAARLESDSLEPAFREFVESVRFSPQGDPEWDLPTGWKKTNKVVQLRFATLEAEAADSKVEVTVSQLPWSGVDKDRYILNNVNRWRGQMGERAAMLIELQRASEELQLANGSLASFIKIDGRQKGRGMPTGHPPVAPSGDGPSEGPAAGPATADPSSGLKYKAPEGWLPAQPANSMQLAAFRAGEDGQEVKITIIPLGPQAGTLAQNVNRWRSQVLLEPLSDRQVDASSETLEVSGVEGAYVEAIGPRESIFAVLAVHGNRTWFIKLRGDKTIAGQQRENFREFVASVQFP